MNAAHALRRLLLGGLIAALPFTTPAPALADAPQVATQVPGYYRMMVGEFEVTALFDGLFELDSSLLTNARPEDVAALLATRLKTGPKLQTAVNAFLVNTGKHLVLIDTGAASAFGPTLGFIVPNLEAAGYTTDQVDLVLLTHLHADHVAGLLNTEGAPVFPNATVRAAQVEADFWLPAAALENADAASKPFFAAAQSTTAPYIAANKWQTFGDGTAILPGVTAQALPGHTPGHSGFLLESAGTRLLIWGDIIHNAATQFANPGIAIEFDVDQAQAVATRKATLATAAEQGLQVAGAHLPFPGIGRVRASAPGSYEWIPVEFGPLR